jgi:hypothetical protein
MTGPTLGQSECPACLPRFSTHTARRFLPSQVDPKAPIASKIQEVFAINTLMAPIASNDHLSGIGFSCLTAWRLYSSQVENCKAPHCRQRTFPGDNVFIHVAQRSFPFYCPTNDLHHLERPFCVYRFSTHVAHSLSLHGLVRVKPFCSKPKQKPSTQR